MRSVVPLLALLVLPLAGCFNGGCWESSRAETWHQAAYWDWVPDPALGLVSTHQGLNASLPWPDPPAHWRGNQSVAFVQWVVRDDYTVRVGPGRGTEPEVWAFLPQKMKASDREQAVRDAVQGATTATTAETERIVQDVMAADDGGDSTGRFMIVGAPGLTLDLDRLAALGPWTTSQERAGGWDLEHENWRVFVELETRGIRQTTEPYEDLWVDAGGYVVGPMLDAELSAAERLAQTTDLMAAWGAPTPTYESAGTAAQRTCT